MTESGPERKAVPEVGVDAFRDGLTDFMDRTAMVGERFIVTRNGKPRSALIGMKDFYRLLALDAA